MDRSSTILDAMRSEALFAKWFDGESWQAWKSFLRILFHLPVDAASRALYEECTGRSELPSSAFSEAWLVCGRRSGKSLILSLAAVYLALFKPWRQHAVPGENLTVMLIARDRLQARVCLAYIKAFLNETPALRRYVLNMTAERVELIDDIVIEVHACSYRSVRGRTIICALLDEVGFWDADPDSAEPDQEILNAIRPSLGGIPGSMLLCASSAYAKRGALWDAYQTHWGQDGDDVLCWKAATATMNPTYPQKVIESAFRRDPSRAAAEYGSEFRSDAESYVSRETIEVLVDSGVHERAPMADTVYHGFVDAAGGSGSDAFCLAISHHQDGKAMLDCLRHRAPRFSPESVCKEYAAVLRHYGISTIESDRWGADFVIEAFGRYGISCRQSAAPKSDLYAELLMALNSGQVRLLDQPHMVDEFVSLERKTARGGRDSIDHPKGANCHDDMANACAGALLPALRLPFDPKESDFAVTNAPIAGQVREALAAGHSHAEARMIAGRITPWSEDRRAPSRPGPFIV